ncbi:2622_t:CDS:2 [Paraglomus brasilianum]|uniref:2622_t:CDS:1 n=1 Tax=Paraglomus brasilianum TaxID=144538 RepID=A0A9N9FEQ0_9GLOM|nr:2622_t:CDS:2 [Paraglomus brasilianum]
MNNGFTYPDGTGLMQLSNKNPPSFNDLYIRLLHPNGTLTKLNFNDTGLSQQYACPLNNGYVLIIQGKINDNNVYGKLVDWSGQVLQRDIMLAENRTSLISIAKANVDPDKGFLVATSYYNTVLWKIFRAPHNSTNQIIKLHEDTLENVKNQTLQSFQVFPTTEGGYGIALLNKVSKPALNETSSPQWFFKGRREYVKVAFLSSGAVTNVNVILNDTLQPRRSSQHLMRPFYRPPHRSGSPDLP